MKRLLKWLLIVLVVVALGALTAFLYFIPPFLSTPPETFVKDEEEAAPRVDHIQDPAQRVIAERGRYIVVRTGCIGCHMTPGPQGPRWDMYLAGGAKFVTAAAGQVVTRNLTPDQETGLGKKSNEDILRVLRNGVFSDGRTISTRHMPWGAFSNLTEEDRFAIVTYLRALKPIRHAIPNPDPTVRLPNADAAEVSFAGQDYGK
jgi:hypothetical protein